MKAAKKSIIITGATGFLGRNLIKKLVYAYPKEKILCLIYKKENNLETSGRKILKKLSVDIKLVDLAKNLGLADIPKNPDLVFHLAAETDTSKPNHKVNDIGIKNLYKAFKMLNKKTHFVHIGTMIEVVGRPNCQYPIDETSKDFPTNEYTRTKLVGEKFIKQKCIKDKFKLTIVRPNTIYGKGVRKNSLFDLVVGMVKNNSIVTRINWPGKSALIHVEDLADLIINISKIPPSPGKPQKYLAYSENISIYQISEIIHNKLNKKFSAIKLPFFVWSILKNFRTFTPKLEKLLPYNLYNYFWRLGIISDDVVWCESSKVFSKFANFKPKKFTEAVGDVV